MASVQSFDLELTTYEREKERLLSASEGKYVVIRGDTIAGVWDTYEDALRAGYRQFGLEPFLVKQIRRIEQVYYFTRDISTCQS